MHPERPPTIKQKKWWVENIAATVEVLVNIVTVGIDGMGGVRVVERSDGRTGGQMPGDDDTSVSSIAGIVEETCEGSRDVREREKEKNKELCVRERECGKCWLGIKDAQVRYGTCTGMDADT